MLSAYELKREETIAANSAVLVELGLEPLEPRKPSRAPSAKKRQRTSKPEQPRRQSSRFQQQDESGAPALADKPAPTRLAPWEEAVFASCEASHGATVAADTFDQRRMHQHLTRSASGQSVATTGVAGSKSSSKPSSS